MLTPASSALFETLTIRQWTLRNRVVMPPMVTVREIVGADGLEWYSQHAAGGPGLVIIEATAVPRFGQDLTVETLIPLVDAIHTKGALAAIQLFPVIISRDAELDLNEMSLADIQRIVTDCRRAARICQAAGMDGVEPHGAHGFLLNRFFSPAHNRRRDEYGGNLHNRMRLGLEIVRAMVDEVGSELMMLYRHTPVQADSYGLEDSLAFARELVSAGVDVLDLSPSSGEAPGDLAAPFMELGAKVITVGNLDKPERAEEVLHEGRADLVAIGRGLIADPDWANKLAAGKADTITKCVRCDVKCFGNLKQRIPIACTQW